jgi:putative component of membrane protein insertase Oxa1/YidC/SpoIIIJ protein YidD
MRRGLTRRRLRRLAAVALLAAAAFDLSREPENQFLARGYLAAVDAYRGQASPHLRGACACRFTPTCSAYSAECVRRHGLLPGLGLTAARLARCGGPTPPHTPDPPPAR